MNERPQEPEDVAQSLLDDGIKLGLSEKAIIVYDELLERFGKESESPLNEILAKAYYLKGNCLYSLKQSEKAIRAYDDLLVRFNTATEFVLIELVAKALYNKAVLLSFESPEAAIVIYEQLLHQFGDATEPAVRSTCAEALLEKATMLVALQRPEEAIAAYDELARRYSGQDEEVEVDYHVTAGLLSKADLLKDLNRIAEALAAYDFLIELCRERSPKGMMRTFLQEKTWLWNKKSEDAKSAKMALVKS